MIKITLTEMVLQKKCKLIIICKIRLTQIEWILVMMEWASMIRQISFTISINIHMIWIIITFKVLIETITLKIKIFKMNSSIKYKSNQYKDLAPLIILHRKISKFIQIYTIAHNLKIILILDTKIILFKILKTQDIH